MAARGGIGAAEWTTPVSMRHSRARSAGLPKPLWWAVAGYVFFLPVQFMAGNFNAAPSDAFMFVFLLLGLPWLRFPRSAWSLWHVALLLAFAIGTFVSGWDNGTLSRFVYLNKAFGVAFLFLTYAVITSVASDWSKVRPLLRVFIWAVTLNVIAGTLVLFLGPRVGFTPTWMNYYYGRLSGMLIDPNAFGGLVLTALAIHVSTFFSDRPIVRGLGGLFCVVTLAAGLLLTLSRSAWMGFALALLFSIPFRPRMLATYAVIAVFAVGLLYLVLGRSEQSEVLRIANRPETAEQRIMQIQQAIPMVREHPIFGIGLGGFLDTHGWIIHDTTVWMLTEFGLVGLGSFLGFVAWFVLRGARAFFATSGPDRYLILGLICAHIGMFGVSFGIEAFYQRHWWLAMALLASVPMAGMGRMRRPGAVRAEVGR